MSDRKYRHRGYQDGGGYSSSTPSTEKKPREPREPQKQRLEGAPRGRTAGGFGPEVFKCARCGQVRRDFEEILADEVCPCGTDVHSCINCKHFDTSTQWECRAKIEARVSPKDKRNLCPEFSPKIIKDLAADKVAPARPTSADDARKAFDALFKK
jgi:hypothetical protein